MILNQQSFIGGMRLNVDPAKLSDNEYNFLSNGRTRYDNIQLINKPTKITTGLYGTRYQGTYAADNYHLVFIDGAAFVKDFNAPASAYAQVAGFQLDPNVEYIYAELVPASRENFLRQAGGSPNQAITLGSTTSGTPQAVICQDGINQPQLIETGLTTREANTYQNWTVDNREYVPIGKQMVFANNKLYIVSPDGQQIYQSVSGRPLDFVVPIMGDGDKIDPDESKGGASIVSIGVDYNAITCIAAAGTEEGALLVTTNKNSYLVIPDRTQAIYGEPKYKNVPLFSTGAVNQFSVTDVLGDLSLISFSGIHSFNAALQLKNEGKNAPFSAEVYSLFEDVVQSSPCAINFDDYAMYAVDTKYGSGILVYDTLRNKFNSFDILSGVSRIKMFAEVKIVGVRKLLFITEDGLYCFGDSDTKEECKLLTKAFSALQPKHQLKPTKILGQFCCMSGANAGSVRWFVDEESRHTYSFAIDGPSAHVGNEIPIPFDKKDSSNFFSKSTPKERHGSQIQALITWSGAGELNSLEMAANEIKREQPSA